MIMPPTPPSAPAPPPDARSLQDAALRHLARYSATQAGLLRVLGRRIDRWARTADPDTAAAGRAAAQAAARSVVSRLAAAGAVDDAAFAASRARSLARAGRSRRAISAHLAARGVPAELTALPDDPAAELAAALAYARRRRIGPFRQPPDAEQRLRDLARLARAGFAQSVAEAALATAPDAAEAIVLAARQQ
jgi:regulatory protein